MNPPQTLQTFGSLVKAYVDERLELDPVFADSLGVSRYDARMPDLTAAGHAKLIATLRSWRSRFEPRTGVMDTVDVTADRRALLDDIDGTLYEDGALAPWRTDPQTYIEPLGDAIFLPMIRAAKPADERFGAIAIRLTLIPAIVDAAITNLDRPTKVATELAIDQNRGTIEMYSTDLPEAAKAASPDVQKRIEQNLPGALAALRKLQAFLEGPLLARSDRDPRVGAAVFDRMLALETGTDESRATLVAHARAMIAATRAEMLRIAEPLDREYFPDRTHNQTGDARVTAVVGEVFARLGEDRPTPEGFLPAVQADAAKVTSFLQRGDLVRLPEPGTLQVRTTPAFQAGTAGASFQGPGPFDPLAPSYYNVDPIPASWSAARTESYLREYNDYGLQMLTIHEALPGHYVQFRYGETNPSLTRKVFGNGAYVEGWAVYAEGMMLDNGYGGGDPRLRLYQLRWRLREYTNAILDAEYHAGNLDREAALQMMIEGAFQTGAEAEGKWHRLELSHDQLSTYFAGLEAMQAAKAQSGLSTAEFNRRVLLIGAVEPRFIEPLLRVSR